MAYVSKDSWGNQLLTNDSGRPHIVLRIHLSSRTPTHTVGDRYGCPSPRVIFFWSLTAHQEIFSVPSPETCKVREPNCRASDLLLTNPSAVDSAMDRPKEGNTSEVCANSIAARKDRINHGDLCRGTRGAGTETATRIPGLPGPAMPNEDNFAHINQNRCPPFQFFEVLIDGIEALGDHRSRRIFPWIAI